MDGRPVVVTGGYSDHAQVWDLHTGERIGAPLMDPDVPDLSALEPVEEERLRSLREHGAAVVRCTTIEGRPVVVVAAYDGTVRVWDLAWRRSDRRSVARPAASRQ